MKKGLILLAIGVVIAIGAIVAGYYYRGSVQNTPKATPTDARLVAADSPTMGAADAPVTIVEFLDPECESCAAYAPTVKKILKDYDGKVKLVIRYMPLHPNSLLAASWTEAAGEQGKYWQMQELLFQKQGEWGERHGPAQHGAPAQRPAAELFEKYAMELGLDVEKIKAAVKENKFAAKIDRDKKDGQSLGVSRTPTLFVNGKQMMGLSESNLRSMIDTELKK